MCVKDKLIELLEAIPHATRLCPNLYVDELIANGVTVQEWIPVNERLPEKDDYILCSRGNHIGAMMDVYTYKGDGKLEDAYGYWNYTDIEGITHWMPLPPAPKGE